MALKAQHLANMAIPILDIKVLMYWLVSSHYLETPPPSATLSI